jgi:hypothetical protein
MPTGDYSRLRIVSPHAKFAYLLLSSFVIVTVYVTMTLTLGPWAGTLSSGPLLLIVTGYAVRNFRDPDVEPYAAPREWWRMTARPTSGYVFAVLFLAQALWVALGAFRQPDAWALLVGVATEALLGVMFLRSSTKLRAGLGVGPLA